MARGTVAVKHICVCVCVDGWGGGSRSSVCVSISHRLGMLHTRCCGCGGGSKGRCTDLPGDDAGGVNCDWYADNHSQYCGRYDSATFTAATKCCACEWGLKITTSATCLVHGASTRASADRCVHSGDRKMMARMLASLV